MDLMDLMHLWRHPAARGAAGRCIGRTDLRCEPRRAKRVAHRIRALARREHLPRAVVTSTRRRSADVGRWLRRWGWTHLVDPALDEVDFGRWEGRRWSDLPRAELDAWTADLPHYGPGGGESVGALLRRVSAWCPPPGVRIAVTHGGVLSALAWQATARPEPPTAATWPRPPAHGVHVVHAWPPTAHAEAITG